MVEVRLNAAKKHRGLTWRELFDLCDKDGSGEPAEGLGLANITGHCSRYSSDGTIGRAINFEA